MTTAEMSLHMVQLSTDNSIRSLCRVVDVRGVICGIVVRGQRYCVNCHPWCKAWNASVRLPLLNEIILSHPLHLPALTASFLQQKEGIERCTNKVQEVVNAKNSSYFFRGSINTDSYLQLWRIHVNQPIPFLSYIAQYLTLGLLYPTSRTVWLHMTKVHVTQQPEVAGPAQGLYLNWKTK